MIGADIDVCRVCSNISILLSNGMIDILDMAISGIIALSRVKGFRDQRNNRAAHSIEIEHVEEILDCVIVENNIGRRLCESTGNQ